MGIKSYITEKYNNSLYDGGKILCKGLVLLNYDVKMNGCDKYITEGIDGPCIIAPTHRKWWDIPIVGTKIDERVQYLAKEELFHVPVLGNFMKRINAIPVNRQNPKRQTIRDCVDSLNSGYKLIIYPEGTRNSENDEVKDIQSGISLIATKAKPNIPIIPVAVTYDDSNKSILNKGIAYLNVGDPLLTEDYKEDKKYNKEKLLTDLKSDLESLVLENLRRK